MDNKVCLRCKGKTLLGVVNKLFKSYYVPQLNFPTNNLNFHWRWRWWERLSNSNMNFKYWSKSRKWCAFIFSWKIGYTARWRLFATTDYLVCNYTSIAEKFVLKWHLLWQKVRNGILLPKFFWPILRKKILVIKKKF